MESEVIDFVIPWVDGADPEWLEERRQFESEEDRNLNNNEARFRDWGLLKYWFRSVERYAPWVRKIHLVTSGQCPEWLDLHCEKLHFVTHSDFIPSVYLPTFSSFPIELNLHRIKGLAERFVYFNDDMFVLAPVKPTDFFKNGLPRDVAIRNIPMLYEIGHNNLNCINLINREFDFKRQFKQFFWKWLNYRYGIHALRSLFFLPFVEFTGAKNSHLANSYLKNTFEQIWEKYGDELDKTCKHRFRCSQDLLQWVFKYWQLVSGQFFPQWINFGKTYGIQDLKRVEKDVSLKRYKVVCLQDCENVKDISDLKESVIRVFQKEFPGKSSFEL